ncbi:MAG: YlmC/YmxH family sporulation protein [Clostridiales bacterium]|nr:YlmC/YmxH family sporulation protein [Clostridiales bacterium]
MEISFCDLKCKDVISISDGKNMGAISDIVFDSCCGKIIGIIVPCNRNFFNIFKANNDIFIPYNRICKIGKDIILVDIIIQNDICNKECNNINFYKNNQNQININSILRENNNDEK